MVTSPATRTPGPPRAAWVVALLRDAGLLRPRVQWTRDRHWRAALWAALPVWFALGAWAGPSMRAPVDLAAWVSLVLVRPLVEEVVVRGLTQGWLMRWFASPTGTRRSPLSVANLLTTAAFVALHLGSQPWAWALAVAAPSLVLGHLRERLNSTWPGVLLHAYYNLGFGVVAWAAR